MIASARILFLLIMASAAWNAVMCQKIEYIKLQPNQGAINTSIFSNVEVYDARLDTSALVGFVCHQKSRFSYFLSLSQSLKDELTSIVNNLVHDATKQNGALLITIHKFRISKLYGGGRHWGEFNFDIGFYIKQDTLYRKLFEVDSSVIVHGNSRSENILIDSTNATIGELIQKAAGFDLTLLDKTKAYTAYEIEHAGDLEKKNIPVYNTDQPKRGIYATFEDFKNDRPTNEQVLIEYRKGFSRPFVFEKKANGEKGKEILRRYYYIVCDGDHLFISDKYGLEQVIRINNDFYFSSGGSFLKQVYSDAFLSSLSFLALWDTKNSSYATFEYKIDPLTGKFLVVRKIRD